MTVKNNNVISRINIKLFEKMKNIKILNVFRVFDILLIIASVIFINNVAFMQTDYSAQITACNVAGGTWQETYCQYPQYSGGTNAYPSGGSYSSDPSTACSQSGGTYDSQMNYCQMPGTASTNYSMSGCGGPGQPACSGGPVMGPCGGQNEPACPVSGSYYPSYPSSGCGSPGMPPCDGSYSGGTSGNSNWVKHTWQLLDGVESSYILNRTDQEYQDFIARTHAKCVMTSRSNFSWKPDAGNDASYNWQNFGIPECTSEGSTTGQMPYPNQTQPTETISSCISRKLPSDLYQKMSYNYPSLTADERQRVEEANRTCNQELYPQSQMYQQQYQTQPQSQSVYPQPQQHQEYQMMNQEQTQQMTDSPRLPYCNIKDYQREAKRMERDVKNLNRKIKKLTKSGMTISQELQANLQELNNIISQIKSITKCEDINDIGQEMVPEIMQNIYEGINNLERLNQVPRMIKKARSEIKKMDRRYARIEKKAQRSKINIFGILERIKIDLSELRKNLDDATLSLKAGDAESTNEYMQDFFEGTQPVWEDLNQAYSIFNINRFVKNGKREIKQMEREIKSLNRKKINTTQMSAAVQEAKNWLMQIQSLIKEGISDAEEAFDLMNEGNEIRDAYNEAKQDALNFGREEQIMKNTKKQLPFLEKLLPRLEIPKNLLKALIRPFN